ncbi:hypothetical protein [Mastigocoleus testarum]|uniref:Uncharacterized protein n=1 Tax=Mastigocoleus testarum BC008 TaxID=371196 RepID=A0A0V7ZU86_9CYAN|nr:hypothetical protein [Mastigocoleus testarum]KST68030.1 hypothetical protein BC008_32120 [Mastigocoleus testarum BC008]KST68345.1 hypothetical protein BC008_33005 [Mastigocoleus testarum BC008]
MNQQNNILQPNLFELTGYNTKISYSATSIAGVPLLTYSQNDKTLSFKGEEIRSEETNLGQSVTVTLKSNLADEGFESLTLLLPTINLPEKSLTSSITTLAILSQRPGFIPTNTTGQLQQYQSIFLYGTAQKVES